MWTTMFRDNVHAMCWAYISLSMLFKRQRNGRGLSAKTFRNTPVASGRLVHVLLNLLGLVADDLRGSAGDCLLTDEAGLHHVLLLDGPAYRGRFDISQQRIV